jgi:hypothetical protein
MFTWLRKEKKIRRLLTSNLLLFLLQIQKYYITLWAPVPTLVLDLVGRPVKKGSMLILRKNRPMQQI